MANYSFIEKFLHQLALDNSFIKKSLYDLEKIIYLKKIDLNNVSLDKHIFISGLPRSGTTGILNMFYSTNEFASLTYENMPFVLAPNLSKILKNKNKILVKRQRAHNDGVFFNFHSPEAFDEVFFSFCKKNIKEELKIYISLILYSKSKKRYLSKNNYNYLNLELLKNVFPNSFFIIPFRNPLDQANSLLKLHKHFLVLHKNDSFVKKYMSYLGHYEFGEIHKPWNTPINFFDTLNINYWLEQWYLFYENIEKKFNENGNFILFPYDSLNDEKFLKIISIKTEIKNNLKFSYINSKNNYSLNQIDNVLLNSSNILYKNLKKICSNV